MDLAFGCKDDSLQNGVAKTTLQACKGRKAHKAGSARQMP
jgi:hypothetical protein